VALDLGRWCRDHLAVSTPARWLPRWLPNRHLARLFVALLGPPPEEVGEEPDPRFSYANERTFLAWNRTALALISVGLAVTNLLPPFDLPFARRLIGLPLIALGAFVALYSLREWSGNQRAMRQRRPLPVARLPLLVSVVIGVIAIVALVVAAVGGS
jgi:putative membrane protein